MPRPHSQYSDTPLWKALSRVLAELQASREITVSTAPDYVVDYLCQELAAKRLLHADALTRETDP
jgi:hypothetical protein